MSGGKKVVFTVGALSDGGEHGFQLKQCKIYKLTEKRNVGRKKWPLNRTFVGIGFSIAQTAKVGSKDKNSTRTSSRGEVAGTLVGLCSALREMMRKLQSVRSGLEAHQQTKMPPRIHLSLPLRTSLRSQSSTPHPTVRLFLPSLSLQSQYRSASILSSLSDNPSAYHKRIRRGRGPSSGKGKTSGRGHKGQRQHGKVPRNFEGGQTPIAIVHGKRGFKNV